MSQPFSTVWNEGQRILTIRFSGVVTMEQVQAWENQLYAMSRQIGPQGPIKILVDGRGYEVAEQDPAVHQAQRVVVPVFLAKHNFTVGYFKLFEAENTISADLSLATCRAVAHVHHDRHKMDMCNETISSSYERFFTDAAAAHDWLCAVA